MGECGYAMKIVLVGEKSGRVLVLRRSMEEDPFPGMWDLPGGKVEDPEKLREEMEREILEETGREIRVGWVYPLRMWEVPGKKRVGVTVLVPVESEFPVRLSGEHTEYRWVREGELKEDVPPGIKRDLEAAYRAWREISRK